MNEKNLILKTMPHTYSITHAVFVLLSLPLGSLYFRWIFCNYNDNLYPTIFSVIFILYVYLFMKIRGKAIKKETIFFMLITVVYSLRLAFTHTNVISTLALLVIHVTALLFTSSAGRNSESSIIDNIIPNTFNAVIISPFSSFFALPLSLTAFLKKHGTNKNVGEKRTEKIAFIIIGIIISIPLLAVSAVLLSDDAFFSSFFADISEFLHNIMFNFDIEEYFNIITVLVSMFLYGAVFSSEKQKLIKTYTDTLPATISNTVIFMLLALYALFFISQINGYICMLTGKLPNNTTYSEFARSGFFNLCITACINGAVIYITKTFTNCHNNKLTPILHVILTALTLLLIATAAAKMFMYITEYGFTEKRFYTLWFMLLLSIIFTMTFIKLKKQKFNLSRYSVYITAAMLAILFFIDFGAISNILNTRIGF